MCDEIGEKGTYHTHIYFRCKNPVDFKTVKNKFPSANIEKPKGTDNECYKYIRKISHSEKSSTNLPDTYEESDNFSSLLKPAKITTSEAVYDMLRNHATNNEIFESYPSYITKGSYLDNARQSILSEEYKNTFRVLDVFYIYGPTRCGKTSYVMNKYGYPNVYRVTNYNHPFDSYNGQDVILFDEFRDSLPLPDMLNYLDGYPLTLPARYADRVACYTKVFLISNIPLENQYRDIQRNEPASFEAFKARINHPVWFMCDKSTRSPWEESSC